MTGGSSAHAEMSGGIHLASAWPPGGTELCRLRRTASRTNAGQRKGQGVRSAQEDVLRSAHLLRAGPVATGRARSGIRRRPCEGCGLAGLNGGGANGN